jgi:hypothetical protein
MKIVLKNIFIYTFGFFILIQLIQVDIKNKDINKDEEIKASKKLIDILKRSCYDCHSNEVIIPWYSKVAPISWTISRHINLGRKWVNFSIWETYTQEQKDKKLEEIYKAVYIAMPLKSYLSQHPNAILSKEDRNFIREWTGKAPFNDK